MELDPIGLVDKAFESGFNLIHPLLPADANETALAMVFDRAEELGMWIAPGLSYNSVRSFPPSPPRRTSSGADPLCRACSPRSAAASARAPASQAWSAAGNTTYLVEQVEKWQNRSSLLFWYTADESDGQQFAFNSSGLSQSAIRTVDQVHHPVALVLNCGDYFWSEYSAGAGPSSPVLPSPSLPFPCLLSAPSRPSKAYGS